MSLSDEQRERIEDSIMDLHFTSQKYIEGQKDIHKKLLEVNVQEVLEILEDLKDDLKDDPKRYDYTMHMLLPLQIYELMAIRLQKEEEQ